MSRKISDVQNLLTTIDKWTEPKLEILDNVDYSNHINSFESLGALLRCKRIKPESLLKVKALHKVYSRAFNRFMKNYFVSDQYKNTISKYLLWSYHMPDVNRFSVLSEAINLGLVKKSFDEKGKLSLFVVGMKVKVLTEKIKITKINKGETEIKTFHLPEGLIAVEILFTNSELEVLKHEFKSQLKKAKKLEDIYKKVDSSIINPVRLNEECRQTIYDNFKK